MVLLASAVGHTHAETTPVDEYQVKAIFLLNFAKFVEWPVQAFNSTDDPLRICLLGENAFGSLIEEAIRGKTAGNRRFALAQVSSAKEAAECHIVFIPASERKRCRAALGVLKGLSILTVGESEDFLAGGGIVRFKLQDARVRFEIDAEAAARANLKISSKLMSLAENTRK